MLITDSILVCSNSFSSPISNRNGRKKTYVNPFSTKAKKKDLSENSSNEKKSLFPSKRSSSRILIQTGVGVFALGFVDAGYSGDWSRIGVISSGTEDLLKAAVFLVVPLCIFLIFSLSKNDNEE